MKQSDVSLIDHILKVNPAEAQETMKRVKEWKETHGQGFAETEQGASSWRGDIPVPVLKAIEAKYGRQIWKNKKFLREFFDTYKAFRMCEKY